MGILVGKKARIQLQAAVSAEETAVGFAVAKQQPQQRVAPTVPSKYSKAALDC